MLGPCRSSPGPSCWGAMDRARRSEGRPGRSGWPLDRPGSRPHRDWSRCPGHDDGRFLSLKLVENRRTPRPDDPGVVRPNRARQAADASGRVHRGQHVDRTAVSRAVDRVADRRASGQRLPIYACESHEITGQVRQRAARRRAGRRRSDRRRRARRPGLRARCWGRSGANSYRLGCCRPIATPRAH